MIVLAVLFIIGVTIRKWVTGLSLDNVGAGALLTLLTAVMNAGLGWYLLRTGKRTQSLILEADGKHELTDSWTSAGGGGRTGAGDVDRVEALGCHLRARGGAEYSVVGRKSDLAVGDRTAGHRRSEDRQLAAAETGHALRRVGHPVSRRAVPQHGATIAGGGTPAVRRFAAGGRGAPSGHPAKGAPGGDAGAAGRSDHASGSAGRSRS